MWKFLLDKNFAKPSYLCIGLWKKNFANAVKRLCNLLHRTINKCVKFFANESRWRNWGEFLCIRYMPIIATESLPDVRCYHLIIRWFQVHLTLSLIVILESGVPDMGVSERDQLLHTKMDPTKINSWHKRDKLFIKSAAYVGYTAKLSFMEINIII